MEGFWKEQIFPPYYLGAPETMSITSRIGREFLEVTGISAMLTCFWVMVVSPGLFRKISEGLRARLEFQPMLPQNMHVNVVVALLCPRILINNLINQILYNSFGLHYLLYWTINSCGHSNHLKFNCNLIML